MTRRILVLGDLMIDEYVNVSVERISPEAPVPVMTALSRSTRPGGAANVSENIIAMGGGVEVISVVSSPSPFTGNFLVQDVDRVTTTKTRFVAPNGQQIARLDDENTHHLTAEIESLLMDRIVAAFSTHVDVLVISDYAKGVCTKRILHTAIIQAQHKEIPIIVDPKRANWEIYEGATLITPNEKEYGDYLDRRGDTDNSDFRNILVTLGNRGMTLHRENGVHHFAAHARQVFDVTGAGDTVVAAMAVGMANGRSLDDCCGMASIAAGIVVGKRGTATVTMEEINAYKS